MIADIQTRQPTGDLVRSLSIDALPTSENGWPLRPFQIVSLLEMFSFDAHRFMYMPDAEAKYYDQEQLFGTEVNESFSDARLDISSSGNCIACGLYTASVYHLMRVAEFGLRRIAKELHVKLMNRRKPITIE